MSSVCTENCGLTPSYSEIAAGAPVVNPHLRYHDRGKVEGRIGTLPLRILRRLTALLLLYMATLSGKRTVLVGQQSAQLKISKEEGEQGY